MSKDDLDFDALMASMGVRKLDPGGKGAAKKPRAKAGKSAVRAQSTRAARSPASGGVGRSSSTPARRPSTAEPLGRGRVRAVPAPSPARMELQLAEAERARRAAEAELAALREELAAARSASAVAQEQAEAAETATGELDRRFRKLQRRFSALQSEASQPRALADCLRARGLRGDSEAALLVRALDEVGRLPELLSLLAERPGEDLAGFLDERIVLLGDCAHCPVPEGRAVLRLPRERCEVCGGSDIARDVRLLEDDLLLHGFRRITIVGGSPKYRRQLKMLFHDPRLRFRLQPGDVRVTRKKARSDIDTSDLLVVWGGTILDHAVSELYSPAEQDRARLVRVADRGIRSMVRGLRRALRELS